MFFLINHYLSFYLSKSAPGERGMIVSPPYHYFKGSEKKIGQQQNNTISESSRRQGVQERISRWVPSTQMLSFPIKRGEERGDSTGLYSTHRQCPVTTFHPWDISHTMRRCTLRFFLAWKVKCASNFAPIKRSRHDYTAVFSRILTCLAAVTTIATILPRKYRLI